MKNTSFQLNGKTCSVSIDPVTTVLEVVRRHLGLLGTKEGCNEGECGACTVLLDGQPIDSCLYPIGACEGRQITTIEGLGKPDSLTPIQSAMLETGGVQCGFCTPGIVMTLTALLLQNPEPTRFQVKDALSGNLCRCTGYSQVVEACMMVARDSEGKI